MGELIQAKRSSERDNHKLDLEAYVIDYITKSYYKTASLLSHGCRAIAVVHDLPEYEQENFFRFGANLGIAF